MHNLIPGIVFVPGCERLFGASRVKHFSSVEINAHIAVEDTSHEALGFGNGAFKGSKRRWSAVDQEVCAVIRTLNKQMRSLPWSRVDFCNHRKLTNRFNPEASSGPQSRAAALWL